MSFSQTQKTFLRSPHFAVVGASKDKTKIGTQVLQWYQSRKLDVTPVHPKEKELEGLQTVTSIAELPSPTETSISVITPPKVTLGVLQAAKDLKVPAIWIQPGAEDDAVVAYVKDEANGLSDKVIYGGPCILVKGDSIRSNI